MLSLERRDGRPLCIGHRGAAALAPENTLRSFRAGVEAGADIIEFDVLGLGSGELVVAHSYDLHEVSHGAAGGSLLELIARGGAGGRARPSNPRGGAHLLRGRGA